mmetsp:Transcript_2521/g.3564  ORF Transcript_2521/g.3564 Transcript_2521/m.3564 type:complete len:100 (+) Transcript_2521:475-774(+)
MGLFRNNKKNGQILEFTKDDKEEVEPVFNNMGLDTWEKARSKWRTDRTKNKREKLPPVSYDEVIKGLSQVQRTFDLPGKMALSDIVDVFVDIWECEKDY